MNKHRPAEHISSAQSDHLRTMDAKLDAALADTFPASDPVAITAAWLRHERIGDDIAQPGGKFTTRCVSSDFVAPSASRSVIAKVSGGTPGFIRQGVSYHVYAQVTDTGSPASGISTVTANTSAFDTGATAAALAAGSYTVGGQSYNYRTGTLTANASISPGTHNYSLTLADAGGNSRTQTGFSVTVDNTAPTAADVQTANGASIAGRPEQNDTVTFTYSEPVDPNSILAGWTGAQTDVVVRINNNIAASGGNDQLIVANSANTALLPITGSTPHLNLGRIDYVGVNRTFGLTGTKSRMTMSGNSITIILGTQSGAGTTAVANGTMTWTPSTTPTDPAGNSVSSAARTETGTADREF